MGAHIAGYALAVLPIREAATGRLRNAVEVNIDILRESKRELT